MVRWTDGELARLRDLWPYHEREWDGWGLALPGRSWSAIKNKARELGLMHARAWTREQHVDLVTGMREVVRATGHTGRECAEEFVALLRRCGWN